MRAFHYNGAMAFICTQGKFLPAGSKIISAGDRSFRFGDGIFETVLVANGRAYNLAAHLARLKEGLKFFRMALDTSGIEKECAALIQENNVSSGYLRIIVSRGEGDGVGYLPQNTVPYYILQTVEKPFPAFSTISLCVSDHRASLRLPCKTNSAALYTLAMLEAKEKGCDNALILDAHGHVCETASENIFWVKDNIIYTPELSLPLIPGTIRQKVLGHFPVKEGRYMLEDLESADEIFATNAGGLVSKVSAVSPLGFAAKSHASAEAIYAYLQSDIAQETQG